MNERKMTNLERAMRGVNALRAAAMAVGDDLDNEAVRSEDDYSRTALTDFLADLMHAGFEIEEYHDAAHGQFHANLVAEKKGTT